MVTHHWREVDEWKHRDRRSVRMQGKRRVDGENRVRHEVLSFFAFARVVRREVWQHARRRSAGPDRLSSKEDDALRADSRSLCLRGCG